MCGASIEKNSRNRNAATETPKRARPSMGKADGSAPRLLVYLRWCDPRACHQRGGPAQRPYHRSRNCRHRRAVPWLVSKAGTNDRQAPPLHRRVEPPASLDTGLDLVTFALAGIGRIRPWTPSARAPSIDRGASRRTQPDPPASAGVPLALAESDRPSRTRFVRLLLCLRPSRQALATGAVLTAGQRAFAGGVSRGPGSRVPVRPGRQDRSCGGACSAMVAARKRRVSAGCWISRRSMS